MLEISGLSACYGESVILKGIDMRIGNGQVVCLLGRNGVGKTTLLKSVMGLAKTPAGSIKLRGKEIGKIPTYARALHGIGYVPQGRDIFPQLSVYENLLMGLERNRKKGMPDEKVFELFPALRGVLKRKGGDLSGGQQQQLAIARALVSEPEFLLLDEPTEGIQPSIIQEIAQAIKKLKAKGNVAMLIVEQYLEFVMGVADYFYVMDKGKIVMQGFCNEADIKKLQDTVAI